MPPRVIATLQAATKLFMLIRLNGKGEVNDPAQMHVQPY